jgi:hypothetical protein
MRDLKAVLQPIFRPEFRFQAAKESRLESNKRPGICLQAPS